MGGPWGGQSLSSAARAGPQSYSAMVEVVAVLLRAILHLRGQNQGFPEVSRLLGLGLGLNYGVVEVVAVLLRSHLDLG